MVIKSFMYGKEGGGKSYRPEQMRCAKILRRYLKEDVKTEYKVDNLTIDGYPTKDAYLDIAIPSQKLGIRLNGGIHLSSKKQMNHDNDQRMALEECGWRIVDFWENEMPLLWNEKKSIKEKEVVNEVISKIVKT